MQNLIDELTPAHVRAWVSEATLERAREDVGRGRVSRPAIRPRRIEAFVADSRRGRVKVALYLSGGEILSACDCLNRTLAPCRHAAAVALLVTGGARFDEWSARPGTSGDVRAQERDRRRQRGESDLFDITAPATGIYGRYGVASPSGEEYEVVVRALDQPHNGCTCPDLATNRLGTCKHIEAALHHARRRDRAGYDRARSDGPPSSYFHVWPGDEPAIGLRFGPSADERLRRQLGRYFRPDGRLAGELVASWPEMAYLAHELAVEFPREVEQLAMRAVEAAERQRRRRDIELEVLRAGPDQPGFRATLYPYQVEGVAMLASRHRALLADDMGLGKTAQAIAAMVRLMRKDGVRRTLVVCPASLKHQWEREIRRFTTLAPVQIQVVGGPREQRLQIYQDAREVVITSYELVRTDYRELQELGADLLILDEAQRIKNWRTVTANRIKRLPSRYAFVLTGTPLENRLDDLYSLMQAVDPHVLGPLWQFNADFSHLDDRGKPTGYKNLDRLRERLADVMLRRRKEDVLTQLPPQIVNRLLVPMTPRQTAIHADAEQQVGQLLSQLKRRPLTPSEEQRLMRGFQRLRMVCDAAGLCDKETVGAPKLDELESLLDEICIQGGRKVVVFSEWERMQAMAAEVCKRLRLDAVCLNGGVPTAARPALLDRFREDPRCKVFLSTDAGGVGLNLQSASYLINLDLPWNPAVLNQRIGRVHRLGQTEPVNVVLLISRGGFEERMEGTLAAKRSLFEAVVGDDDRTTDLARTSLASRIATLLSETFAAATGAEATGKDLVPPVDGSESAAAGPTVGPEPIMTLTIPVGSAGAAIGTSTLPESQRDGVDNHPAGGTPALPGSQRSADPAIEPLRRRLGDGFVRALRLPGGQIVAVTRGDPSTPAVDGAVVLSNAAQEALAALGPASPLAGAVVVFDAGSPAGADPALAARLGRLAAAERKLAAGRHLAGTGLGAEALPLFRDAIALACRSLDDRGDPGEDPAALLGAIYGHLVPAGVLTSGDASSYARAAELARAFAMSPLTPADDLVALVEQDARDMLARARESVGAVAVA